MRLLLTQQSTILNDHKYEIFQFTDTNKKRMKGSNFSRPVINIKTKEFLTLKMLFSGIKDIKPDSCMGIVLDISNIDNGKKEIVLNMATKYLYKFDKYKSKKDCNYEVFIYDNTRFTEGIIKRNEYIEFTRDLINEPANIAYPKYICDYAKHNLKRVKVKAYNKAELKKQGLNLIYNIGKGSDHHPMFLVMEYTPKVINSKTKTICLCGKGVTFDAGGTNIKTGSNNSYAMKGDKTGGCIVIGMMKYFSEVGINCKLVGLVPLVENIVSSKSIVPGDIIRAYNGKTVEILDTDAEGRLILADALSYSEQYNPDYIFDFATLTGWSSKLHCDTSAIYYSPSESLHKMIDEIGETVGERVWGMPKWLDYMSYCRSKVADLKNHDLTIDGCNSGGGYMASMFLAHFVPKKCINRWVHFDICNNIYKHIMNANSMILAIDLIKKLINIK